MNENILNFPTFTIFERVVPKTMFYRQLDINTRMKELFVENIEQIIWLYKLAPFNLHIDKGKEVHEIAIMLVKIKTTQTSVQEILRFLDERIPQFTIFILQKEEQFCLLVNYKQWKDAKAGIFEIVKTFSTNWHSVSSLPAILLDNLSNMDALYASLVRQIASTQIISTQKDLREAVKETKAIEYIKKEMDSIKKKEARERQPQKKFALHQRYLQLKKQLNPR